MAHYLGIDIGTSSVKTLLMDGNGTVVGTAGESYPASTPKPLWSEQEPDLWWNATLNTLKQIKHDFPVPFSDVQCIGLSGQMHGAVMLDESLNPVRPAILWNDGRSHQQAEDMNREFPELGNVAGVPAMSGFTAPKLRWMEEHEPDAFKSIRHILLPKDYVRLKLTGELATDVSDGAGTLWLDEESREWSDKMLELSGLRPDQMVTLKEGTEETGQLLAEIASELGLSTSVTLCAGGGDAACGAIGIGAINQGDAFISLGTSAQYFVTTETYKPYPHALVHSFAHAVPERWFQMACMLNGASPLKWFADLTKQDIGELIADLEADYDPTQPTLFLPYLMGERTPHNNPFATASFHHMTWATKGHHMTQAILEGVGFSLLDCQNAIQESGTKVEFLGAIGGGTKSRLWLQIIANILGIKILRYEGGESGPAYGAARLAKLCDTGEPVSSVCHAPKVLEEIVPNPEYQAIYQKKYQEFKTLYSEYEKQRSSRVGASYVHL
ncbi:Xylulose kinase [Vibrio nigripulchritudo SO65]|uniref:xylulokinase n=1 Tax=Vibrio nigripulchritudo TaxID=28173 RepID=UPI0003B1AA2C|nr:xylulokinase [Vibrio nigripulchritudo]CCN34465.1 Xylulose kinase [Vibrio nigripulchritudo AM115]CCN43279.1 Xylulose kinase [Vibrio nigripulchritudo FTn2]CCN63763.1 Xylulose kinase [Vibrio nigripulchritudo POn4]CCN77089.1 Xylulose kinase [Vibrio nigripulchritudo SO65]